MVYGRCFLSVSWLLARGCLFSKIVSSVPLSCGRRYSAIVLHKEHASTQPIAYTENKTIHLTQIILAFKVGKRALKNVEF